MNCDILDLNWGADKNSGVPSDKKKDSISSGSINGSDNIYRVHNKVMFNAEVDTDTINNLMKLIREVCHSPLDGTQSKNDIFVWINSYGGSVTELFRFVDFLEWEVIPKVNRCVSVVHGTAASAGSCMAAAFPERLVTKRSTIMIHELIALNIGNFTALSQFQKFLEKSMNDVTDIYAKHMSISREDIKKMLLENRWFTPQEALDLGLASQII